MFFHTRHRYNTRFLLLNFPLFSHWCFTHQYKNTTHFYFYAALLSSQNTNLLSGIQCAVVNCSTDVPALYPWNTDSYANSLNFLVALGTDSNNFSVYSVGGTKNIICIKEFDGYTNTPRLYIADNKIYVNLKDHKLSYQVLIVRFGKLLE